MAWLFSDVAISVRYLRTKAFHCAGVSAARVIRITGGNFRLIERLFSQVDRVLKINNLQVVTREVVETARESLVIGPP